MTRPLLTRAVIRLAPTDASEDVTDFLQGLVTNDVTKAQADQPVYAGLLSPQGKALFDFFIWSADFEHGAGFLIDCEKDAADELVKRLSLYRLRRKIEIAIDEGCSVHWASPELLEDHGNDPRLPALGFRAMIHSAPKGEGADEKYLSHRLSLGVTEGRAEIADILWLETNAAELNGVSFEKGCYVGQENTARMNWRQKINRRLIVLPLAFSNEKRRKASYPDLELAVDHLRVDGMPAGLAPKWLEQASGEED